MTTYPSPPSFRWLISIFRRRDAPLRGIDWSARFVLVHHLPPFSLFSVPGPASLFRGISSPLPAPSFSRFSLSSVYGRFHSGHLLFCAGLTETGPGSGPSFLPRDLVFHTFPPPPPCTPLLPPPRPLLVLFHVSLCWIYQLRYFLIQGAAMAVVNFFPGLRLLP